MWKKDEMINHIVSESSKHVQKEYKTRHDWVGKVVHWQLCKKLKFDHITKYYMHKQESVQEKIPWDFEVQTNHLIPTRKTNQVIINKKKEKLIADNRVKIKESEKIDKYLNFTRELKSAIEHEGDADTNCSWYTWNGPQTLGKRIKII